jgi:hypothetical protein
MAAKCALVNAGYWDCVHWNGVRGGHGSLYPDEIADLNAYTFLAGMVDDSIIPELSGAYAARKVWERLETLYGTFEILDRMTSITKVKRINSANGIIRYMEEMRQAIQEYEDREILTDSEKISICTSGLVGEHKALGRSLKGYDLL